MGVGVARTSDRRLPVTSPSQMAGTGTGVGRLLASGVAWVLRHWLAWFLLAFGTFVGLALAAPMLAAAGFDALSGLIYFAYRFTCHQLPHRSYFLFGEQTLYGWEHIHATLGLVSESRYALIHAPVRHAELGYQTALCHRDLAIYTALLGVGAGFAVLRRDRWIPPLPWKLFALALVPIAVDGLSQLVGLRTSDALLRTLTGALFGAATGLLVLPHLEIGVQEILDADFGGQDTSSAGTGASDPASAAQPSAERRPSTAPSTAVERTEASRGT